MILTYKIKHNRDYTQELAKAREVALWALETKSRTSKDVKHIGLPSAISNQILKKYSSNRKVKRISRDNMTVPRQAIKVNKEQSTLIIKCLNLILRYYFDNDFEK